MNNDPLSKFRPGQQQPAQAPQRQPPQLEPELLTRPEPELDPKTGKEIYYAYKGNNRKIDRLEIRRVLGDWRFPRYSHLEDGGFNGHFGTELVLVFSFYIVYVKGRNLDPIIYAIEEGRCAFIQDYHPNEFAPLIHPNAPFIESIIIRAKGGKEPRDNEMEILRSGA